MDKKLSKDDSFFLILQGIHIFFLWVPLYVSNFFFNQIFQCSQKDFRRDKIWLSLYLHHPSMHVPIFLFTSLPFLSLRNSPILLLSLFFSLKLSQSKQPVPPPRDPKSIPFFSVFRLQCLTPFILYFHLYIFIYFLFF